MKRKTVLLILLVCLLFFCILGAIFKHKNLENSKKVLEFESIMQLPATINATIITNHSPSLHPITATAYQDWKYSEKTTLTALKKSDISSYAINRLDILPVNSDSKVLFSFNSTDYPSNQYKLEEIVLEKKESDAEIFTVIDAYYSEKSHEIEITDLPKSQEEVIYGLHIKFAQNGTVSYYFKLKNIN